MLQPPFLRIEAAHCSPRSFVLDLSRQVRRLTEELESAKNELQPLKELLSLRSAWVQTLQRRKVSRCPAFLSRVFRLGFGVLAEVLKQRKKKEIFKFKGFSCLFFESILHHIALSSPRISYCVF